MTFLGEKEIEINLLPSDIIFERMLRKNHWMMKLIGLCYLSDICSCFLFHPGQSGSLWSTSLSQVVGNYSEKYSEMRLSNRTYFMLPA